MILFDPIVAREYLHVMKALGLEVNTSKSVVANNATTEFAKVTSYKGMNVSALSWKMFMSGNTFMGRANIVYSLLCKGVVQRGINPWLERTTALSLHKKGNPLPTYLAIWTMLSNRGIISVEEALKTLIDGTEKVFKLARAILLKADLNKIKLALPAAITGRDFVLHQRSTVETIFNMELPWMKIAMWKPLAVAQARRDIQLDIHTLTCKVTEVLFPKLGLTDPELVVECQTLVTDVGDFYTNGAPDLSKIDQLPDPLKLDFQVLFGFLYNLLLEKAESIASLDDIQGDIDSEVALLVKSNENLDRYNELLALVSRYDDKIAKVDAPPARVIRPSQMTLVRLLTKMSKNRPHFTTAASLW
jgi:hypothetical protein